MEIFKSALLSNRQTVALRQYAFLVSRRSQMPAQARSGLAAGLGFGAAQEAVRRSMSPQHLQQQQSFWMSEANVRRLVSSLSAMRGAALKLGQFMSIQGEI